MAYLKFDSVSLEYPIFGSAAMSIKHRLVNVSTGGQLSKESSRLAKVTALKDVSFELKDGDAVGIVGHNGAGKTTLLRTMAGVYKPTSGRIDRTGRVSTIIELGAGLDSELSGYENIFRMGMLVGMSKEKIESLIPAIEEFTELGNFLSAPVRTYSSGMLMRLMFAVTTAETPEILIVDEMFGTGDSAFQEKARLRMENLISSSKIFVFATHSDGLIAKFCNRVFEIQHGKLKEIR
jgi:ABC-type polysaccharide/polyol phosphate transport system ATPase subunit